MLRYSLRRLLLSLPVLWFLITAVFLLSRLLPGTYGSESMLYNDGSTISKGSQQLRNETYQAYLHRTGQDLPIFYFSLDTSVKPLQESAPGVASSSSRLEEQLSWIFGSSKNAKDYTSKLYELENELKKEQDLNSLAAIRRLYYLTSADSILHYTTTLGKSSPTKQAKLVAADLQQSAVNMAHGKESLHYLLPSFRWHGTDNQYHRWFSMLLTGDLGTSFRDARPVTEILQDAVSNTFWLTFISMALVSLIALELSIVLVKNTRVGWRKLFLPTLFILDSIPLFVLSLVLLLLFASPEFLPLFPVFGLGYYGYQPDNWLEQLIQTGPYLILPIASLVLANIPYLTNQTYRSLADTMQAAYIKTARSKGLRESHIIRRHAFKNALLPIITVLSDYLPALIAGSVVIETIFAIPGIGRLLITSVMARDTPVILGIVLLTALVKMASHFIADISYAQVDPRVRKAATV